MNKATKFTEPTSSLAARLSALLGFASVVIGILMAFFPGIEVSPSETLDSSDPYAQLFTIKNDGWLPLTSTTFEWHPNYVEVAESSKMWIKEIEFDTDLKNIGTLSAREETTVRCDMKVIYSGGFIKGADVTVRVSAKLLGFLPVRPHIASFTAVRDVSGNLHWVPRGHQKVILPSKVDPLERSGRIEMRRKEWNW